MNLALQSLVFLFLGEEKVGHEGSELKPARTPVARMIPTTQVPTDRPTDRTVKNDEICPYRRRKTVSVDAVAGNPLFVV